MKYGTNRVRVRCSNTSEKLFPLLYKYPDTKKNIVRNIGEKNFITVSSHCGRWLYITIKNAKPLDTSIQGIL